MYGLTSCNVFIGLFKIGFSWHIFNWLLLYLHLQINMLNWNFFETLSKTLNLILFLKPRHESISNISFCTKWRYLKTVFVFSIATKKILAIRMMIHNLTENWFEISAKCFEMDIAAAAVHSRILVFEWMSCLLLLLLYYYIRNPFHMISLRYMGSYIGVYLI